MVHWKHGRTVYGQRFNLWFFWSKVAFQWSWNFHITLDVEDNVTHFLQHIFIVFHFYVKSNSFIKIIEKKLTKFENIQYLQSLNAEVGVSNENDKMDGYPWYNRNVVDMMSDDSCLLQWAWMPILKQVWFKVLPMLLKKYYCNMEHPQAWKFASPRLNDLLRASIYFWNIVLLQIIMKSNKTCTLPILKRLKNLLVEVEFRGGGWRHDVDPQWLLFLREALWGLLRNKVLKLTIWLINVG